jgi:hypothetical protein
MKIDIFKDNTLRNLIKYNGEIRKVTDDVDWNHDPAMGLVEGKLISKWFNPDTGHLNPLPGTYPELSPCQKEKKWCLLGFIPYYTSLFVISKLYHDNKKILIEDACTGLGRFPFYLSKMGFENLTVIDNWSQLPQFMFMRLMKVGGVFPTINDLTCEPTVVNISGYIYYPKKLVKGKRYFGDDKADIYISPKTELFCTYLRVPHVIAPLKRAGFDFLATDVDETMFVYCRRHLKGKFEERLRFYDPTISTSV